MGYRVENRKLQIVEEEARTIRTIFVVYLRTRSTIAAAGELTRMGMTSKVQTPVRGKAKGGIPFTYGPLQWVLRNRIYVGEISHKGQHYPSHPQREPSRAEPSPRLGRAAPLDRQAGLSEDPVRSGRRNRGRVA
jgi:Recombinase